MDAAFDLMLLAGGLLAGSILVGVLSQRVGAPLMLAFLGLGMLMGEEGPGGVIFDDFRGGFLAASMALAVILFDGGLRTPIDTLRAGYKPAVLLATIGVLITAGITGAAAALVLDSGWLHGLLIGAIVASTDAAAVFLLLHQRGTELRRRVGASLELESGLNDPMAVFLTVTLVAFVQEGGVSSGADFDFWSAGLLFLQQMGVGLLIGVGGGFLLAQVVNRLELAAGLYPVFVTASALILFAVAQKLDGSGFLAAYVAGIVTGNHRLRADRLIRRFHDGLSWISQIMLLVMLGLLVTPSRLLPDLIPGIAVALVLIFIARPVAVFLCLAPFRFDWDERAFIAWVGLRGAVPIVLAMIAALSGVPDGSQLFHIAFIVVIASLLLQGWTIPRLSRALDMDIAPAPEADGRMDVDLASNFDRDVVAYTIRPGAKVIGKVISAIGWPKRTRLLTIIRDGVVLPKEKWEALEPGDYVLLITPPEFAHEVDRLMLTQENRRIRPVDFEFAGETPFRGIAGAYSLPWEPDEARSVGEVLADELAGRPQAGDVARFGTAALVVMEADRDGNILRVGLRLDAPTLRRRWRRIMERTKKRFGRS